MEDSAQATPHTRRLGGEESYWTIGVYFLTWLAEGKDTDGHYSLAEVVIPRDPPRSGRRLRGPRRSSRSMFYRGSERRPSPTDEREYPPRPYGATRP